MTAEIVWIDTPTYSATSFIVGGRIRPDDKVGNLLWKHFNDHMNDHMNVRIVRLFFLRCQSELVPDVTNGSGAMTNDGWR